MFINMSNMSRRPPLSSVRHSASSREKRNDVVSKYSRLYAVSEICNNLLRLAGSKILLTISIYVSIVLVVSLFTDYIYKLPPSYFSNKRNILNVYFVKIGWGWTSLLVGFTVFLTSSIRYGGDSKCILRNISRIVCCTLWWHLCTSLFEYIRKTVGFCSGSISLSSNSCKTNIWSELDISGHSFLLFFCILVILEESKTFSNWDLSSNKLLSLRKKYKNSDKGQTSQAKMFTNSPLFYFVIILLTMLFVLWNVMLLVTLFYFHDTLQKFLGIVFAIIGWWLFYRFMFMLNLSYLPMCPEH